MPQICFQARYFSICGNGHDPRKTEILHNGALWWPIKVVLGAKCTKTIFWTYLSCSKIQLGTTVATREFQCCSREPKILMSTKGNLWANDRARRNFWAAKVSPRGCISAVSAKNHLNWPSQHPFMPICSFVHCRVCPFAHMAACKKLNQGQRAPKKKIRDPMTKSPPR